MSRRSAAAWGSAVRGSEPHAIGKPARLEAHPHALALDDPRPERATSRMQQAAGVEDEGADRPRRERWRCVQRERLIPRPVLVRLAEALSELRLGATDERVVLHFRP